MTATKYIILMLIGLVGASFVISVSDIDPIMHAFLAGGVAANVLRLGILALLVMLLVTNPPRSLRIRLLSIAASAMMVGLCMFQLLSYNAFVVDAIIYIELAIVFAIEALEIKEPHPSVRPAFSGRRSVRA